MEEASDKAIEQIRSQDVIWFRPSEKHWHVKASSRAEQKGKTIMRLLVAMPTHWSFFLPRGLPFVTDDRHGLGQIALRGAVIALGNSHEDGVEYIKLRDTGGGVLA